MSQVIAASPDIVSYARGGDFRLEALAASAALLGNAGAPHDLGDARVSICISARDQREMLQMRRLARVGTVVTWAVLISLGVALVLVGWAFAQRDVLFGLYSYGFFAFGILPVFVYMPWLIKVVGATIAVRVLGTDLRLRDAACVSVQDAKTFPCVKVMPDDSYDFGLLWFDAEKRRLCIEGLSHRYLICADDVVEVRRRGRPLWSYTEIRYRIGAAELAIVLGESLNESDRVRRQRGPVYARVVAAIGTGLGLGAAAGSESAVHEDNEEFCWCADMG